MTDKSLLRWPATSKDYIRGLKLKCIGEPHSKEKMLRCLSEKKHLQATMQAKCGPRSACLRPLDYVLFSWNFFSNLFYANVVGTSKSEVVKMCRRVLLKDFWFHQIWSISVQILFPLDPTLAYSQQFKLNFFTEK